MRDSTRPRPDHPSGSGYRLSLVVALALAVHACSEATPPLPSPDRAAFRWVAGDLHVHSSGASNDTDGASFPELIATTAKARGLAWVALTDHSNSTGSMHCEDVEQCPNLGPEFPHAALTATLSDDDFVMVQANELSPIASLDRLGGPVGHVGCLPPPEGFNFQQAFVDRPPGALNGASTVAECRRAHGWAVINHPFVASAWIAYDWSTLDFDALEVWNGGAGWDLWDQSALNAWECLIAQGYPVVPVAGSDNHRTRIPPPGDVLNPPLGQPRTSVALDQNEALAWSSLAQALRLGRVRLHEEKSFIDAQQRGDGSWQLSGVAPLPATVQLREIPQLGPADCRPEAPDAPVHQLLFQAEVHGDFHLEASLRSLRSQAKIYAFLQPHDAPSTMATGVAMTGLVELTSP